MKCDLCKRDNPTQKLLCECCADAVHRLMKIQQRTVQPEKGAAQKLMWNAAHAGASGE
jgi:hypothetical protein